MSHSNETLPTTTTTSTTTTGTFFSYHIPGMDISPGPFLFTLVSEFLGVITPSELPLGQVRQLLHSNLTIIEFGTNAIKTESGFIALMSIFMILALVPIIATCCWCCCRRSPQDEIEYNRNTPRAMIDDSVEDSLQCRKKASLTTMWLVFILLSLSDLCIFYANSRLSTTVESTPEMIKSTVHDMEVFLKDTHLQIKHKLDNGFHVSVEKVVKDLEDVDVLLGEPIQAEISAHTGIELAYDSLATLSLANAELIYRVLMLQETVGRAMKLSQEAAARMEELQIQLSVLQRQCTYRDRPLCDTLRIRSFEENGIIDALKTLQEDQSIFRMRYLGEIEFGATVKNLSSEVGMSRSIFSNFPQQVKLDTAYERNYTLEQLENVRHRTTANAQMLTVTINALLERLKNVWDDVQPHYAKLQDWSNIYWGIGWAAGMIGVWILIFLLMSYCCFLCESNVRAGVVLFVAVVIICLSSIFITIYGVLSLAIGGNAEIFLCQPLYDEQMTTTSTGLAVVPGDGNANNNMGYDTLGKLFDKPGYVYSHEPQFGIIGELLRPDGVNRPIVNVSLATALRGCEKNEASYNVFQLDAFVNTTAISNIKQFPKVTQAIDEIEISERTLLSLTQTIQNILENMLATSTFNLTTYRSTIGAPTPEKDLATFIDQMQRVALQIQDVATSSRMTTLGSRSKRLQASILQPLEQLQNEILYHLTALELQRDPWAKQVNQTLNHLRNIQEYLERTASEICHNQTRIYTNRLKTYLSNDKATMSSQLGETTAKCRPFFDIFDANRIFLCRNMIDFVNALWFFTFLTLLLWSIGTPVGLNLITLQRKLNNLRKAKLRVVERATERGDSFSRGRRRDRDSRSPRDRSTSSTGRPKPTLQRSVTQETLDIADESGRDRQYERGRGYDRQRDREPERERSRDRDRPSRGRDTQETPVRRPRPLRRQGTEEEILDSISSAPSRGTSNERDVSQSRARSSSSQQQQRRLQPPAQPQRYRTPPVLRRQGTEEFDLDNEETTRQPRSRSSDQPQQRRSQPPTQQPQRYRTPPVLQRRGTEEFDLDNVEPTSQYRARSSNDQQQQQRRSQPPTQPSRFRTPPVLKRRGTEEFDLDNEESTSQPRVRSSNEQRQQRRSEPPPHTQRFITPPVLKRQGTEEFNLDNDDSWQSPSQQGRGRSEPRRGRDDRQQQQRNRRSITPVLQARPDAQPAQPQPRTASRLRNRVSLTTRAVANIVKNRNNNPSRALKRQGTQEFNMDEDTNYNNYGTSRSNSQAVEAARRTPPRSAPPPPPPPSNRFQASSVRSVRWNARDEDLVFEDCDSGNPMYMSHDLND